MFMHRVKLLYSKDGASHTLTHDINAEDAVTALGLVTSLHQGTLQGARIQDIKSGAKTNPTEQPK
jgi:hypothetical protein